MARRSGMGGTQPKSGRWGAGVGALATAVALSLSGTAATPAGAAEAGPAETVGDPPETGPSSYSPRQYYSTWRDARTYWSQESQHPTGGWLRAGRHAFFCQVEGEPHSDGEGYSTWWALTDDETGNRDVFVSATAFRVAEPWQPVEGLPRC
ncbi:hypothetical protein [Nocardiopsis oceani]